MGRIRTGDDTEGNFSRLATSFASAVQAPEIKAKLVALGFYGPHLHGSCALETGRTGVPGSRHRGEHDRVSADRHAGGRHRGAGGVVFPTAKVIDAGPWSQLDETLPAPICTRISASTLLHDFNSPSQCIGSRSRVPRRPLTEEHLSPPSTQLGGCFCAGFRPPE